MYMKTLFLIIVVASISGNEQNNTVKVSIYYETLCPYSIEFITDQVQPAFKTLGPYLQFDLNPFGLAKHDKTDGKWETSCQHGPKECYGNKLQACALRINSSQDVGESFCICLMTNKDPTLDENVNKCAQQNKLDAKVLRDCAISEQGDEDLAYFQNLTENRLPPKYYVPNVWFDDKFNETLENLARGDLVGTACDLFKNKPGVCKKQ